MKAKLFLTAFLIVTLLLSTIPIAHAEQEGDSEPTLIVGYSEENSPFFAPIIFSETDAYVKLDNGLSYVIEFYKNTAGYNKIFQNGAVLVYDDRVVLEYKHQSQWKQRGVPTDLTWVKISDQYYEVTRHYTDWVGTDYTITYTVKSGEPVKWTLNLDSGQTDEYSVEWSPSGITRNTFTKVNNTYVFGDNSSDSWIGFSWEDVYQAFGNITTATVETVANGKKLTIRFNIGMVEAGQSLTLDPTLIDSYSEANYDTDLSLTNNHPSAIAKNSAGGQTFNATLGYNITSCRFYMMKILNPTGTGYAKLYAHQGVWGATGKPIGAALATSDGFDVATLGGAHALITFTFTGAERYGMTAGTKYVIVFEAPAVGTVDDNNNIYMGYDSSAPSHGGNMVYYQSSAWSDFAAGDMCFYVYGDALAPDTDPPVNNGVTITNADIAPNGTLAMYRDYNFNVSVIEDSLFNVSISFDSSGNNSTVLFVNSTLTFSEHNDTGNYIILNATGSSRTQTGNRTDLGVLVKFPWNHTDDALLDIKVLSFDVAGSNASTTYNNVYWVENDLEFAILNQNVTASGSNRWTGVSMGLNSNGTIEYQGTILNPPDADYHVNVTLSGVTKGSNNTLVSGNFSIDITTESAVGNYTYQVECDYNLTIGGYPWLVADLYIGNFTANPAETALNENSTISWAIISSFNGTTPSYIIDIARNSSSHRIGLTNTSMMENYGSAVTYNYSINAISDAIYGVMSFTTDFVSVSWLNLLPYDIWLNDYSGRYLDGTLKTHRRDTGALTDTNTFNGTYVEIDLLPGRTYYFEVNKSGFTFRSEAWQPLATELSHMITIIQMEIDPSGIVWDYVLWDAGRLGNYTIATIVFRDASDATVSTFNATNTLMDNQTYLGVTGINYQWVNATGNQTYWIILNATVPGLTGEFKEVKVAYRIPNPGESYLVNLPIFSSGMIDPAIFSLCLLMGVGFIFSAYNRVIGLIIATTFLGIFTYFQWLDYSVSVMGILIVVVVFYAMYNRGGEPKS